MFIQIQQFPFMRIRIQDLLIKYLPIKKIVFYNFILNDNTIAYLRLNLS